MDGRQLVVSDLDGTLLGDGEALKRFSQWYERVHNQVRLVYASGRLFSSIRECVKMTDLPKPEVVIAGVGTEIRCFDTGRPLFDWPTASTRHWNAAVVRSALDRVPHLELQPDEFQSDFKVSYFLRDATADELLRIAALLRTNRLECELVYSSQEHLDVLPRGINKGTATRHLVRHLQLDDRSVVVCGDTGNDAAMFQQGFRGVIVANAREELKRFAGARIYQAQQKHAGGVLEGLQHWLQ